MVHLKAGQLPTRTLLHGQDAFLLEKKTTPRKNLPGLVNNYGKLWKDPPFLMGNPKNHGKIHHAI
jgi:hypothetical protein